MLRAQLQISNHDAPFGGCEVKPDRSRLSNRRAHAPVTVQALTAKKLTQINGEPTHGRAAAALTRFFAWSAAHLPRRLIPPLALGAFILASSAAAGDRVLWTSLSHVILAPADGPHVATVEFLNGSVHMTGIETHALDIPGLSITVTADVGHGTRPDTITVTVPEGFYAWPESLTVAEGGTDTLLIYRDSAELF